ncbi:hypothetical protein [Paraliomyxa miuraensis]|uniref:hypothetical protein n=1 Tax=Paraliomyxa miuraensis TaxID=376150 RepID=UPI00224D8DD2|nr:hypothetical protein [Paraliomyxa miuraensis]MCX4244341.1 hypothetical protein [Paraliomyxa miuraensis]
MMRTPDFAALELLRALFDLAEADIRPSVDLLERLLDLDVSQSHALVTQLRRAKLVQQDRLGLTMAGLAVAASMPETEPRPMRSPLPALCAA